jgi:photosystem II stability/assembly factor-like uncharacterized protein
MAVGSRWKDHSMKSARWILRIAAAALVVVAPALASALERCDKNHFILNEPCSPGWTAINGGLTDLDVQVLAIDPVNKTTLYAGGPSGVFKSIDGGVAWSMTGLEMASQDAAYTAAFTAAAYHILRNPPPRGFGAFVAASQVRHLAIDSRNPNTLYAATNWITGAWYPQRRLFKSTDGGETWTDSVTPAYSNGVENIVSLVLAPSDPDTLYYTNFDGVGDMASPIVRSTDGAATWTYLGYPALNVLAVDPLDSRAVYAGTFDFAPEFTTLPNGVLKSRDGGVTWTATGLTGSGITALTVDAGNSRTLYAATGSSGFWSPKFRGLFKSVDGGANWADIDNGLGGLIGTSAVTVVVVDPRDADKVYVATSGGGISRSLDGGATWSPFNEGLQSMVVRSLALVPGSPNTLYAGTTSGVFKAVD